MKKISAELAEQIEQFKSIRLEELVEASMWVKNGDENAVWHWDSKEKQQASLEGSYEFFISSYPYIEEQTDENIIRFCGKEVYDLWNDYKDNNIQSRANHCAALYSFINDRLQKKDSKESIMTTGTELGILLDKGEILHQQMDAIFIRYNVKHLDLKSLPKKGKDEWDKLFREKDGITTEIGKLFKNKPGNKTHKI